MRINLVVVAVLAATAFAQTTSHRTVQVGRPNTNAPTKVTGDGVTTESGLQYWDIKLGLGPIAKAGDHVKVHYTGWLTTGKKFDSSVDANSPYEFTLGEGNVIKGWDEGVAGMKVGGKRQLRIPPELAYGETGFKDVIQPNATLIFDIQLLSVKPAPSTTEGTEKHSGTKSSVELCVLCG